jgi:nucleotide-binding universal stress UspA family protein
VLQPTPTDAIMHLLTLKSILVATDLGQTAQAALRTATRLAELAGAELNLLHVTEMPGSGNRLSVQEHYRTLVPGAPEPARVYMVPGAPADVIVQEAARIKADVIVVGPHRRGGATGELGSTASRVVRIAASPCLVVATELRLPLERVLVPVDLAETTRGTLAVAVSWASALRPRRGRTSLEALHVTRDVATPRTERELETEVERARAAAGGSAYVDFRGRIVSAPDPARAIGEAAVAGDADLLAMGTRGATLAESGLGSVSAAVARSTPCPLLLVPPAAWDRHGRDPLPPPRKNNDESGQAGV